MLRVRLPSAAGLVLGWVTVCELVNHLGYDQLSLPSPGAGKINRIPARPAGVKAG